MSESEHLKVRIAWAYYVEGMTQGEVATRFGINRIRVNRLLAACREEGVVQININSPHAPFARLEAEVEKRWGLQRVVVAPRPAPGVDVRKVIAAAAGNHLSELISENQSLGIGWGQTLRWSLQHINRRVVPGLSVVALMGGLTASSTMNAYESASHLADLFGAACYYIAAPAFGRDETSRDLLLSQDIIHEVLNHARRVDCAVVSVGSFDPSSTLVSLGLITDAEIKSLTAAGSVGDLLGHFLDAEGNVIDHPLNKRVVALAPAELKKISSVILVSGGDNKLPPIRAALKGGYVGTLVTDEDTAEKLLT